MTNYYQEHQNLIGRFKILAQEEIKDIRIFDRHVGKFVLMRFIQDMIKGRCQFSDWRRYIIAINKVGMADCYALVPTKVGLIHVELEFKTGKAVLSKAQKNWRRFILSMNGIHVTVRNENEAVSELKGKLNGHH